MTDKYKELINIGLKSILSTTYIRIYGILPNNPNKRIETFLDRGIEKIILIYNEMETNNRILQTNDIKEMAELAKRSNKLCRILAKREVVLMLLGIIAGGDQLWENGYSHRAPLTELIIHQFYTILDTDNIMIDCINLLNHILPHVQDIPYDLFSQLVNFHSLTPTSYRLTCAVLRTMTLNRETIQPFISVGMIRIVRFYLDNQFKSEYSQLQDYWLQIAKSIYNDKQLFKSLSLLDQSFVEQYYKMGRFRLWLPKELRINPIGTIVETVSDGIGYYFGLFNGTTLFVGHLNLLFSDQRLDSTWSRYLACSMFESTLTLYFTFLLPPKGKIYYIASALTISIISSYQERIVILEKTSNSLYKSFKKYYQTNDQNHDRLFESTINQQNIINNKSIILDYQF
ncbi:hypothetical protein DFA_08039 [Cavenderia fasciculata]|uniref:Uncharacterized protein n=1 Tax=Cavenderia fasciculata TaxID=261658 RepID=F4Q4P9_CACFS|nr:uncharacterized protein DFA_08039 [Cavenderia fasciculata]EGG17058.1 hypothetical protein DFA_08039 [Cavenderia fasciculata]|eukprot:XP_004355542.1 hypothetical protein DFA_08039 [Cavenderia fasciculata]